MQNDDSRETEGHTDIPPDKKKHPNPMIRVLCVLRPETDNNKT